jgi:hypothetical protein
LNSTCYGQLFSLKRLPPLRYLILRYFDLLLFFNFHFTECSHFVIINLHQTLLFRISTLRSASSKVWIETAISTLSWGMDSLCPTLNVPKPDLPLQLSLSSLCHTVCILYSFFMSFLTSEAIKKPQKNLFSTHQSSSSPILLSDSWLSCTG